MLLPAPLAPTSATVSPGRELEVEPVEHEPGPRRVGERDALEPHRRVRAGSAAASRPAGADRRPAPRAARASARRRRARRRSRGTARRAGAAAGRARARARAPSAPPARPRPPSTSRTPTVTATSATPSVAASSSTEPERKRDAQRRPSSRAGSARSTSAIVAGLRAAAVERAQRRQPAHDVEEVGREQPQRQPALARALLRVAADQPHEHRHERQRQRASPAPSVRSIAATQREHGDGHDAGEHELRQVAGEVGLERVDALDRGRRDLACLGAVERGRLAAEPPLDEREPKLGEHRPAPRAGPRPRSPRRARRGAAKASAEQDERRVDIARAGRRRRRAATIRASSDRLQRGRAAPWPTPSGDVEREQARARPARGGGGAGRARARSSLGRRLDAGGSASAGSDARLVAAEPVRGRRGTSSPGRAGRREEDQRDDRHHRERVVRRRGAVDGEAVREVRARDHHARVEAGEERRDDERPSPSAVSANAQPLRRR